MRGGFDSMYCMAVLDDDQAQRDDLLRRVAAYSRAGELDVVACENPSDLRELVRRRHVDVLLADIFLGEGSNGIDLVKELRFEAVGTQVIFVTGCEGQQARARQAVHASFLLKPIKDEELHDVLDRALCAAGEWADHPLLIHGWRNEVGKEEASEQRDLIVFPVEIVFIESRKRVLNIHLKDGKTYVRSYMRLGDMCGLLPGCFVQCHKSFLVNLNHVREFRCDELILSTGDVLTVARSRRHEVEQAFQSYWRGRLRNAPACW